MTHDPLVGVPDDTPTIDKYDLPRDFKPYFVVEQDAWRPTPSGIRVHRRTALVVAVDQDLQEYEWVIDLGPATGAMPLIYATNAGTEWSHILDLMERMKEEARQAEVEDQEEAAVLKEYILNDYNDETRLALKGASTFGPYQRVQRDA